jgi:hypothetical protein
MTALSATLWAWRQPIDRVTGVVNLTNLLYHSTTLAGLVSALVYVESLRHSVLPLRRVLFDAGTGAVAALTMTLAWVAAPIHDRFYPDLAPLAVVASVALYSVVFYLFMAWALARQAVFCFTQGLSREDPARTVSLVLNGSGCGLGTFISGLWAAAVVMRFSASSDPAKLSRIGDTLLPAALITLSLGILTMFVMPWLLDVVRSYLRLRVLRPAWRLLTELHPEVRLRPTRVWGLRAWLETRERRATIEIEDALRLRRLQQDFGGDEGGVNLMVSQLLSERDGSLGQHTLHRTNRVLNHAGRTIPRDRSAEER